jgi:RecB family exonuclease
MSLWISSRATSAFADVVAAVSLQDRIAALPSGPLMVVVPTARQRSEFLVSWARHNGRGEPPDILTMAGFLRHLGRQVIPDGPRILPDSSVDVLVRAAAHQCGVPAGAHRITAARLARWAQEGLTADYLARLAESVDTPRRRTQLSQTARVWSAYLALSGDRACDRGTYAQRVVDAIQLPDQVVVCTQAGDVVDRVLVLDTHGLTFTDKMVLHALCRVDWDVAVAFADEVDRDPDAVPSRSRVDRTWLVAHGWTPVGSAADIVPVGRALSAHATTRSDEVRRALGIVKEELAMGTPLSEIALCIPGRSDYGPIVDELAELAEIPLDRTGGRPLAETRLACAFHAAASVIADGWRRDDLDRLLRDPLVRDVVPDGARLIRIAIEDRITGGEGPQSWMDRCTALRDEAQRQRDRDTEDREAWERSLRMYERAMRTARTLQDRLDARVEHPVDVARFAEIMHTNVGVGLGILGTAAEREPGAADALLATLASYRAIATDHDLPRRPFRDHLHQWWSIVRATTVDAPGVRRGLAVVHPAELRGRTRTLVIALGCVDGEFPRHARDLLDDELTPGLQSAMARESYADIRMSVGEHGTVLFLAPRTIDGSAALPSSLIHHVPSCSDAPPWRSLDPRTTVLLGERDLRVRTAEPLAMDTAQTAEILDGLSEPERSVFNTDLVRPVSPSSLDIVAQCPYRYHARKLLRLDQVDGDDERLTPIERGMMLHDVARRFYRDLQRVEPDLTSIAGIRAAAVDLRSVPLDEHWERLVRCLDDVMRSGSTDHTFADVERRTLVGTEHKPGLLRQWLAREIHDQNATRMFPVFFEQAVELSVLIPGDAGPLPVAVKVRIDRIDVDMVGDVLSFVVNDYKTTIGDRHGRTKIVAGTSTQMPVYLAAVQAFLTEHGIDARPVGAVYRAFGSSLRSPDAVVSKAVLAEPGSEVAALSGIRGEWVDLPLTDQMNNILARVAVNVADMRRGAYPVRPRPRACEACEFSELCRIDHWGSIPLTTSEEDDEA